MPDLGQARRPSSTNGLSGGTAYAGPARPARRRRCAGSCRGACRGAARCPAGRRPSRRRPCPCRASRRARRRRAPPLWLGTAARCAAGRAADRDRPSPGRATRVNDEMTVSPSQVGVVDEEAPVVGKFGWKARPRSPRSPPALSPDRDVEERRWTRAPSRRSRIRPPCSTTKIRPVPSSEGTTSTGPARPDATVSSFRPAGASVGACVAVASVVADGCPVAGATLGPEDGDAVACPQAVTSATDPTSSARRSRDGGFRIVCRHVRDATKHRSGGPRPAPEVRLVAGRPCYPARREDPCSIEPSPAPVP